MSTPKASQAAVAAVQEALGCVPEPHHHVVRWVTYGGNANEVLHVPTDRGCPGAVSAADGAVGADAPAIAAAERTIHIRGFVHPGDTRPSGVQASLHGGRLVDVANGVLDKVKGFGHTVVTQTTRDLDGWLREVHAYVDVDGTEMWHVFTTASEQWPMAAEVS